MYHINYKGVPAICNAKVGKCPFGKNNDNHFTTKDEAQASADKANEDIHGLLPSLKMYKDAKSMKDKNYIAERKYYLREESDGPAYIDRCLSSKRLENFEHATRETTTHFREDRNEKEIGLKRVVGEGNLIGYYEVNHQVRSRENKTGYRRQIVEVRDNGLLALYDVNTKRKITTFVGHRARIETMMILANEIPSQTLIDNFESSKVAANDAGYDN